MVLLVSSSLNIASTYYRVYAGILGLLTFPPTLSFSSSSSPSPGEAVASIAVLSLQACGPGPLLFSSLLSLPPLSVRGQISWKPVP